MAISDRSGNNTRSNADVKSDVKTPADKADDKVLDGTNEDVRDEKPARKGPEESQIVHRVNATNDRGEPIIIEHGPMPVSEWADYEKEHKL
jgi:hypothetical protein